jgi:hypothetical protein
MADLVAAFTGLTSIARDGAVPLNVGSFNKNTPGMLVAFFSQGLASFRNKASL